MDSYWNAFHQSEDGATWVKLAEVENALEALEVKLREQAERIEQQVAEQHVLIERIAALEADCRDMAEDVCQHAREQHSDGKGGIHPALHRRWRRDTETARKYWPEGGEVDRGS